MGEGLEHHRGWRTLLAVCAVAVPLFGLLEAIDTGYVSDKGFRVLIAATSSATLVGSYASRTVRDHLRALCLVQGYLLHGWFIVSSGWLGMGNARTMGTMLIATLVAMLLETPLELGAFALFTLGAIGVGYAGDGAREVSALFYTASMFTLVATVGVVNLSRIGLEQALVRTRRHLEDRVVERTAALASSNLRLHVEVEERTAAEQRAHRANEAKSRFLANMSHELRTPLNAIVGYTELVREDLGTVDGGDGVDTAALVQDLDAVLGSAVHLLRMIDDVLDLSRIESGDLNLVRAEVELLPLAEEIAARYVVAAANGGVRLQVDVAPGLTVASDRRRLAQILDNLVSNAVKFTRRGSVTLAARGVADDIHGDAPRPWIHGDAPRPSIELAVIDTGVGIPEAAFGRLFQRFAQLDDSPTRRHGGTGLGLALCRELAGALGGSLTVRSTVGVGSTFALHLPIGGFPLPGSSGYTPPPGEAPSPPPPHPPEALAPSAVNTALPSS